MRTALIALGISLLTTACDAECEEPGRIDGTYAVFSNAATDDWTITGLSEDQDEEQMEILGALFANGWSIWSLNYIPGKTNFQLELDGQPFTANYEQEDLSCNSFTLSFSGNYASDAGSIHTFSWEGDLNYFGSHLGGTYSYTDSWTHTADGLSGTITIIDGEMRANEADDTGS